MNKPHKHADLIKAWADGAEMEIQLTSGKWVPCITAPQWWTDFEYRIKPQKKTVWINLYPNDYGNIFSNKENADAHAHRSRVACVEVSLHRRTGP